MKLLSKVASHSLITFWLVCYEHDLCFYKTHNDGNAMCGKKLKTRWRNMPDKEASTCFGLLNVLANNLNFLNLYNFLYDILLNFYIFSNDTFSSICTGSLKSPPNRYSPSSSYLCLSSCSKDWIDLFVYTTVIGIFAPSMFQNIRTVTENYRLMQNRLCCFCRND